MNITIKTLNKYYKNGNQALNDINLTIKNGIFGLLGPNGAGKTTLMRILVTLLKPTSGEIYVNGLDLHKNRREIRSIMGYLPQDFSIYSKLKTWELLDYVASLSGLKDHKQRYEAVDSMLERVGLFEVRDRRAIRLSGGMKRRLGIAQALVGNPKIIVVDEPTTGLDPEERLRFRNLLADLSRQDIIIILSTHIVGDISSSCQDMALLNHGKVVFNGNPAEFVSMANGFIWKTCADDRLLEKVKEKYSVISTTPSEYGYEIRIVAEDLAELNGTPAEPNLEDAYVYYLEKLDRDHS